MVCRLQICRPGPSVRAVGFGQLLMAIQLTPPDVSRFKTRTRTFEDGLGVRVCTFDHAVGQLVEVLCVSPALAAAPGFEFALRERTAALEGLRKQSLSRVRRAERLSDPASSLAVTSEWVAGVRLSRVLDLAEQRQVGIDLDSAFYLIRQLVRAVRALHGVAPEVAHGALAPERLIVTSEGRLVVAEYVLGSALQQLQFPRLRLWQDLHIAMPAAAGPVRFTQRGDVTQIGLVALSLVLGRQLTTYEYPDRLDGLLNQALEASLSPDQRPRLPALRLWLRRALQLDLRSAFASARPAEIALEETILDVRATDLSPAGVQRLLDRCGLGDAAGQQRGSEADRPGTDGAAATGGAAAAKAGRKTAGGRRTRWGKVGLLVALLVVLMLVGIFGIPLNPGSFPLLHDFTPYLLSTE